MRFSTIAAVSTLVLAGFSAACRSNNDCPRGQTCQFMSTKDSEGKCYKRNEGPAAAGVGAGTRSRSASPKKSRREVARAALALAARSLDELAFDELD
ncbi:hypothetical protein H0H87_001435 [Tephrocybe sp. NHM501043]|nr:hypothetical protein H0H87_001435 [Tephrocybe sp. NHM501043]